MKNFTKILSLGVLLLFACSMQLSAQKCISEKDPITGESTIKADQISIFDFQKGVGFTFNKVSEEYYIDVIIGTSGYSGDVLTPDDELIIKLANGKTITFKTKENVNPTLQAFGWSNYTYKVSVSKEEMQNMANSNLIFIRFSISNKKFDLTPSDKDGKKVVKAATCILK